MQRIRHPVWTMALLWVGALACNRDSAPTEAGAQAAKRPVGPGEAPPLAERVQVARSRARAMPAAAPNSAVFMEFENPGPAGALVAAHSPVAETVELHAHTDDGGVMRMRPVDRIDLPSRERVRLEPGGLHVMLIGLTAPLEAGSTLPLTLVFDDDSRRTVLVPVRQIGGGKGRRQHRGDGPGGDGHRQRHRHRRGHSAGPGTGPSGGAGSEVSP
jgi:periplasmic copper chaperone A